MQTSNRKWSLDRDFLKTLRLLFLGYSIVFCLASSVDAQSPSLLEPAKLQLLASKSREIGLRVASLHWQRLSKDGLSAAESVSALKKCCDVYDQASTLYSKLNLNNRYTKEQKQAFCQDIVAFAYLCSGRASSASFGSLANSTLESSLGKDIGQFRPYEGILFSPSFLSLTKARRFDWQLLIAVHEVQHAIEFEEMFLDGLSIDNAADEFKRRVKVWGARNRGSYQLQSEEEIRVHLKSKEIVEEVIGPLEEETAKDFNKYLEMQLRLGDLDVSTIGKDKVETKQKGPVDRFVSAIRNLMPTLSRNFEHDSFNGGFYRRKLQETRDLSQLTKGDTKGNRLKIDTNKSSFGGITLGRPATPSGDERCVGLRFSIGELESTLHLSVSSKGRTVEFDYGPVPTDDLWAAYHILKPTPKMVALTDCWQSEYELVHMEGNSFLGTSACVHPALEQTRIGQQMLELERLSSQTIFPELVDFKKNYADLSLRWRARPFLLQFRSREIEVHQKFQDSVPSMELIVFGQNVPSFDFLKYADRKGWANVLINADARFLEMDPRQLNVERYFSTVGLEVTRSGFIDSIPVDEKYFYRKLLNQGLQLVYIERFAKLLSLISWAANDLASDLPDWPYEVFKPYYPTKTFFRGAYPPIPVKSPFVDAPSHCVVKANPRDDFNHDVGPVGDGTWSIESKDADQITFRIDVGLERQFEGYVKLTKMKPGEEEHFLRESTLLDHGEPSLVMWARKAVGEANDGFERLSRLKSAVSGKLSEVDFKRSFPKNASSVLKGDSGCCRENSVLLAASLRAIGIPSRIVGGYVLKEKDQKAVGHCWVEAGIDDYWYRADSALNPSYSFVYLRTDLEDESNPTFLNKFLFKSFEVLETMADLETNAVESKLEQKLRDTPEAQKFGIACLFTLGESRVNDLKKRGIEASSFQSKWSLQAKQFEKLGIVIPGNYPGRVLDKSLGVCLLSQVSAITRGSMMDRFDAVATASYALPIECAAAVYYQNFSRLQNFVLEDLQNSSWKNLKKRIRTDLETVDFSNVEIGEIEELLYNGTPSESKLKQIMDRLRDRFGNVEIEPSGVLRFRDEFFVSVR